MTKSRGLDEVQTPFYFVNRRHYGEDVKFYFFPSPMVEHYSYCLLGNLMQAVVPPPLMPQKCRLQCYSYCLHDLIHSYIILLFDNIG